MFQVTKSEPAPRFEFLTEDGRKLSLPHLKDAPVQAIAAMERGEELNGTLLVCDTPEAEAYVARLDRDQLGDLTTAWLEHSRAEGLNAGESGASTDS
jgi:hypothetical protein